jgi:hypothetical protein
MDTAPPLATRPDLSAQVSGLSGVGLAH